MAVATAPGLSRYLAAARAVGCPPDQLRNFRAAGIVLQPRQLRASALAREGDHEGGPVEVGYGGARNGGKSHWGMAQVVEDCLRRDGLKALVLRKVGKANRENFEDLRLRLLGTTPHEYTAGRLRFPNGSRIILGHFQNERDVDAYLGLAYEVILVEEATTLTFTKFNSIRTCNRTDRTDWRPRIYTTCNPGGVGHAWFKARYVVPFRKQAEDGTRFVPATIDDNRFADPGNRRILESLTGWQKRAWREGDWDIAAGQFFTTFDRDSVAIPFTGPIPADWFVFLGLDYGFTHYTAVLLFAKDNDGVLHVLDEHGARGWLVERHAEAIKAMLGRHRAIDREGKEVPLTMARVNRAVAGSDCFAARHTGGTIAADYGHNGIPLQPAKVDRISGAAEILRRLGDPKGSPPTTPTVRIDPRCSRLLETLPEMQHDPHRPEDVLKVDCDEEGIGGDDFVDSFRYGTMLGATIRKLGAW
jgi:phage terminase large subunit